MDRRGSLVLRALRRRRRCCRSAPRRTTSASAMATPGPNTGGMGAYSPAPVLTDAIADARDGRDHRARPCAEMAARGHAVSGRALCRADDQGRSGPAGGIQRPLRRPGMSGADDAAWRAGLRPDASLRRGAAGGHAGELGRRSCADRGDGGEGLSGRLCQRARRSAGWTELPEDSSHMVFHAGTARASTARSWPPAAGC